MKKLLLIANVDWFVLSHRMGIAIAAKNRGWDVCIVAKDTGRRKEIEGMGFKFYDFSFSRSGTNAFVEIFTIFKFWILYRKLRPDIVHQVTLKPVTYGSIAAKLLGIKGVVNAISGLGYTFTGNRMGFAQKVLAYLLRFGFNRENVAVIFQNEDDQNVLEKLKVLSNKNKIIRIKGSGVDLKLFKESSFPNFELIKILLPCRMLWDKGVEELRVASELLSNSYKNKIQFILAGMADNGNKAGVPKEYIENWADGNYVKWVGYNTNMVDIYNDCHIVVLPSYREGMPKSLLEACAIGRPIITTDGVGCKECVDEGWNGFKVPVKSSKELAVAIDRLCNDFSLIKIMGHNSRIKAEEEFDVQNVINRHLEIYDFLSTFK